MFLRIYYLALLLAISSLSHANEGCSVIYVEDLNEIGCDKGYQENKTAMICYSSLPCVTASNESDFNKAISVIQKPQQLGLFDATKHYGGKRLEEDKQLPGAPFGTILLPREQLRFSLDEVSEESITLFMLEKAPSWNSIYEAKNISIVSIPSKLLSHDATYRYRVQTNGNAYLGKFSITSETDQQGFQDELTALISTISRPSERLFSSAILARNWDYPYDFITLIKDGKQSLKAGR